MISDTEVTRLTDKKPPLNAETTRPRHEVWLPDGRETGLDVPAGYRREVRPRRSRRRTRLLLRNRTTRHSRRQTRTAEHKG